MRREPTPQSAADIGRAQSQEPTPEPQEEPVQEEAPSEPEQPVQEETPSETTEEQTQTDNTCLLYTSPSPRDSIASRMPSSA